MKTIGVLATTLFASIYAREDSTSSSSDYDHQFGGRLANLRAQLKEKYGDKYDEEKLKQGFMKFKKNGGFKTFLLTLPDGTTQTIQRTDKGNISFTDCNTHTATADFDFHAGTIDFSDFTSTKKSCSGIHNDDEIVEALENTESFEFSIENKGIKLLDEDDEEVGLVTFQWGQQKELSHELFGIKKRRRRRAWKNRRRRF